MSQTATLTVLLAVSGLFFSLFGKYALDMRRDQKHRESWAWAGWSLVPGLASAIYLTAAMEVDVQTRNVVLGLIGAGLGACASIWLGYVISSSLAQPRPPGGGIMSDEKKPVIPPGTSGNFNFNQQGGVNNQTIINQVLPPSINVTGASEWIPVPDGFKKDIDLKVQSPGEINSVEITIHGQNLTSLAFYLDKNAMMRTTGDLKSGPDWLSTTAAPPAAIRGVEIKARQPTEIRIEGKLL